MGLTRSSREEVVTFVRELTKAYPDATVADALRLMLAARRYRGHPTDYADVLTDCPKCFPCIVSEGELKVNLNPTDQPCFDSWVRVCPV